MDDKLNRKDWFTGYAENIVNCLMTYYCQGDSKLPADLLLSRR